MSTPPPLTLWADITRKLYPFLVGFRLSTVSGGLRILARATLLHLAGDAGDPFVVRVGDFVVRLYVDTATHLLYASPSPSAPYTWVVVASGVGPPTIATVGTPIGAATGSSKVTCG